MDEQTNQPRSAHGARGISGHYVSSGRVFELESKAIFDCHWLCVGRIEELNPVSGCLPIRFENQGLILTQDETGMVRAFRNLCRHRGSQLVNEANCGSLGKRIQCPYHAWTYDRTGKLVSAPNMADVENFQHDDHGLIEIACETCAGFVWINFSPQQTVNQWLSPIADWFVNWSVEDLRIAHQIEYEINANWKLIFQNYSECYHCPTVHPMLNRLTPYRGSSNDLKAGPILGGPMDLAEGSQTMSCDGKFAGSPLAGLSSEQVRSVYYFTIFPTMFLSLHPDYVLIHRLERIDIGKTKVVCQFLFHPEAIGQSGFDPGQAIEFWDVTNRQDWEVCELSQVGMSDPAYVPGPYSNLESVVAAFDRHYLDTLG
jgi:Rieske 2Fe-2S family protein